MDNSGTIEPSAELFESICSAFRLKGRLQSFEPFGNGHINGTYRLVLADDGQERAFIAQQINHSVFRNPYEVMENIGLVTEHLRSKGQGTVRFYENASDQTALFYTDGGYWRVADALPGVTYEKTDDPVILTNAGRAFGSFVNALSDLDGKRLHETIPAFHDTLSRFEALCKAEKADLSGRSAAARKELLLFVKGLEKACLVSETAKAGKIPVRVTHNDTKFNNVIMDPETKEAVAVIDLDTVMPGTLLFDYGDAIRYLANTAAEDEQDLSRVRFDPDRFRQFSEGFLSEVKETLTENERRLLPYAPFDATMECGVRFLADHLSGDTYFRIAYPGHNLARARNQLALALDMERHHKEIETVIEEILK
jgi:N-acetylhexosamine 1-kinase